MDNQEKLATYGTKDKDKQKQTHKMNWTPICTNKHNKNRIRISKKNRQHNGKKKSTKGQKTIYKTYT